jgi:outer membrane protein assembly factor BamE (lipoprotein component of BamABCDE complex)
MKRLMFLLVILLSLSGCGLVTLTTTSIEASVNRNDLPKLEIGMSSNQVKGIMGVPNKTEALSSLTEGKKVLVWFYLTEGRGAFRSLADWNYTPIVFENDVLTGWGYAHLDKIRK